MSRPEMFELPAAPVEMVFPEPAQFYGTSAVCGIALLFTAYCAVQAWRTRSPMALLLLVGGMICYLNEPIVDILTLVWHPRPQQWVALTTFGPVPMWGFGIYTIFFGAMTYMTLREARRGITRRAYWISVVFFFLADIACEWPLIHYKLYTYYNDPPFVVFGLPLYWLFINTMGPLIAVTLLHRAPQLFVGWRQVLIPLLPMTTDAAGSVACGWPIMSALNTPGASAELKWAAAALSMAIGLVIMEAVARLICVERRAAVVGAGPRGWPRRSQA